ncbi:MAG: hypothetical protein IKA33_01740 [Candidatus Methanomethylophilaceae archaeon]|nr:hypothetical protein [Candidatus Methanomethylophilaceae archaeon]
MTVASVIVGIVVVAVIALAALVLIRDHRNGNHCASCRGCSMGACKSGCDRGCTPIDEEDRKE